MSELYPAIGTGVSGRTELSVKSEDISAVFEDSPEFATALGYTPSVSPEIAPAAAAPSTNESLDHVPEPGVFNAPKFGA
ncbi:hypothetical protein [Roseibium sp. RKSG952]|uniref:hypothetical protein n=1 Tax=Roseibium sp. RKSG952 TaxID=2529384 RepID=UPI0012BC3226|nr:hypothetical protein [Roseibium sp. RKSG952]MTH96703.1 hypothetical protein [Roseibium sp. RKSG952]